MWKKMIFYWVVAIVITAASYYYQKATGPTNPIGAKVTLNGKEYSFELPRTHGGEEDYRFSLPIDDEQVGGTLYYMRYPSEDEWTAVEFTGEDGALTAYLPHQPPAGKLQYKLSLSDKDQITTVAEKNPVIIRFRGDVPIYVILPHVVLIMAALLVSTLAGITALMNEKSYKIYTYIAFGLLAVGGMILGPIVQQYAFGALWTGVPFGWDLTDNKTLIAFLFYLVAVIGIRKKDRPYLTVIAALIMLAIFTIPHSIFGSELDYSTGTIVTK
jgi:hypothetical protein